MTSLTRNQLLILSTLGGCNFLAGLVYSLQAPFFPAEAEKKGASTTFAGLALGIYELSGCISCPLISSILLHKLGSFWCFHLGILTTGSTLMMFGFLNRVYNTTAFVSLALILRILEAFGAASSFVASYGFLNHVFPENIGTAFSVMETMFAVGMAVGPPLGEALYQLGMGSETWSFTVPFLTMGVVMYLGAFLTSRTLRSMRHLDLTGNPGKNGAPEETKTKENESACVKIVAEKKENFSSFLKVPSIFVFYLTVMAASVCMGFMTCTLEPHLRQFQLSPLQTGGMFLIFGGVYACTASIWGYVCDRTQKPIFVALIGCVLAIMAFTFMGPSMFIPLKPSVALTGVSLSAFGLATGAIYVSGFLLMTNEAKRQGFPETNTLSGAISALWLSGMHLGAFMGPIIGGALFEKFGFGVETMFLVILTSVIFILLLFVFGFNYGCSAPQRAGSRRLSADFEKTEKTPLLPGKEII